MDELTTDFAPDLRVLMLDFNAYFLPALSSS
jgi:hypothetical protein